jgi:hypothetical protein
MIYPDWLPAFNYADWQGWYSKYLLWAEFTYIGNLIGGMLSCMGWFLILIFVSKSENTDN